jgi:hypothetical protein
MIQYLVLLGLTILFCACSTISKYAVRGPTSVNGVTHISKEGETCEVDLDGDARTEKVEISKAFGERVLVIMHPAPAKGKAAKYFVEGLLSGQSVACIANDEPGAPFRGTDETEKAVSIPMRADYLKVETPEKDARFLYFDSTVATYKNLWRAD